MTSSPNESRLRIVLPARWRAMTALGAASLVLACGLSQPVLAELWKFSGPSKPNTNAASTPDSAKTVPAENGFTATIRRLMTESRQCAERGDLNKAVVLAERAAKISEASAQLLGPTSECSPQETAKFAREMRSRQMGIAATQTSSDRAPTIASTVTSAGPLRLPQDPSSPRTKQSNEVPPAAPRRSATPLNQSPVEPSKAEGDIPPAATLVETASETRSLFGPSPEGGGASAATRFRREIQRQRETVEASTSNPTTQRPAPTDFAARSQSTPEATPKPEASTVTGAIPARSFTSVRRLLDDAKTAADQGDLDSAIALAEQAMQPSMDTATLFGPSKGNDIPSTEAEQLLAELRSRRESLEHDKSLATLDTRGTVTTREADEFQPPIAATTMIPGTGSAVESDTRLADADVPSEPERSQKEPVSSATASNLVASNRESVVSPNQSEPAFEGNPNTSEVAPDEPPRSAEWPPAPAAEITPQKKPLRFARSPIRRDAAWEESIPVESPALSDETTSNETSRGDRSESNSSGEFVSRVEPAIPRDVVIHADLVEAEDASSIPPEESADAEPAASQRKSMRIRSGAVQVGTTEQPKESRITSDKQDGWRSVPPANDVALTDSPSPRSDAPGLPADIEFAPPNRTEMAPVDNSQIPSDASPSKPNAEDVETPATRFPVQRVIRLRRRLETAASLNPGGFHVTEQSEETRPEPEAASPDQPPVSETSIRQKPAVRKEFNAVESTTAPEPTWDQSAFTPEASDSSNEPVTERTKRSPLKLRPQRPLPLDADLETTGTLFTSTPNPEKPAPRKPVVGHSEMVLWKAVDSEQSLPTPMTPELSRPPATDASASGMPADSPTISLEGGPSIPVRYVRERSGSQNPDLSPPIAQTGFKLPDERSAVQNGASSSQIAFADRSLQSNASPSSEVRIQAAPPPPVVKETDDTPWNIEDDPDEDGTPDSSRVKQGSFGLIDQVAAFWKLPISTVVSIFVGGGLLLAAFSVFVIRSTGRTRRSS
jgi:hypothetical protein